MPLEQVPCDRKDYVFKDHRKYERGSSVSAADGLGCGGNGSGASLTPRWRDPYHYPQRDFRGPSPRRPLPGHYRQGGGYHSVYSPDSGGHGCTPSRSDKFWSEDESFRPSSSSRYGGGGRSSSGGLGNRDGYGSLRRSPYWDTGDFSRSQHRGGYHGTAPRSVAIPISPAASQPPLKDQNDKTSSGGGVGDDGLGSSGPRFDQRDSPLGSVSSWKSLKWSRQINSSSTKTGETETKESRLEVVVPPGKETPSRSPVTSPLPSDDGLPKKKPRLGWGQGLAKYEKQKVEGSVDASSSGAKGSVCETSPRIVDLPGSMSPATPCSATCSSSQGGETFLAFKAAAEEKASPKTINVEHATYNNSYSTEPSPLHCAEDIPIKVEDFEVNSVAKLTSLLADLLQPEDACSGDSVFTRHSAMSKLLVIKEYVSKELEKTECEIDSFETELRSSDGEVRSDRSQSSKLSAYSVSDACTVAGVIPSNNLVLSNDASKDVIPSGGHAHCVNAVEHDADIKSVDDTSMIYVLPKMNHIKSLVNEISDSEMKDVGICCGSDTLVDLKNIEEQKLATFDASGIESVTELGGAEGVPCGSYANSTASADEKEDSNLINLIMSANHDTSKQASMKLNTDCPIDLPKSDIWEFVKLTTCRTDDSKVKEKLVARKRCLKFKERVLTLKFRAFNHLWKEDLRLLSLRKQRQKSSKRVDLNSRALLHGSQKQRSSIRSRFALPGNLTLVPTTEIVDFSSKVLSETQVKLYRHNLKMPALILDDKERSDTRFITKNGLVEDPLSYEKEREMINPWSQEEKEIFMEVLATVGKNFSKISLYLDHKTTADCIEFYYKNHKSESFKEVKKKLGLIKLQSALPANNYMITSEKKWNVEANAASLDLLGAASVVAAQNDGITKSHKHAGKTIYSASSDWRVSYGSSDKTNSFDFSGNDRETVAADVLAGICGSISSEAMSSCITSSIDPAEKMKLFSVDRSLNAEVTQILDEDICSDEDCGEMDSSAWTDEEKSLLIRALSLYGKDFAAIAVCVRTRTREQCKIFFSKARKCLGLDNINQDKGTGRVPLSETNGGRSDTDDACAGEMDSAICSTQSCSKLEQDLSQSPANNNEGFTCAGSTSPKVENDKSSVQNITGFIVKDDETDDKKVSFFNDDNLICQGSNSPLIMPLKESEGYAKTSNENTLSDEVASSILTKNEAGVSSLSVMPIESVAANSMEAESKPVVTTGIQLEGACGNGSTAGLKKDANQKLSLVADSGFVNRQQRNIDFSSNKGSSFCFAFESVTNATPLVQGNKGSGLHARVALPPNQRKAKLEVRSSVQNKHGILSIPESPHSLPLNSFLSDPSSISFGGQLDLASQSTLNFEEHGNKQHHNILNRDLYQLKPNSSASQIDGQFQILRGYPLQMLTQHEIKGEVDRATEKSVQFDTYTKKNGFPQSNGFFLPASHGNKSIPINLSHPVSGTVCSSKNENQSETQIKSFVQSTDAEEHRTGDVKLFGKILSHPSSKSSSSSHDNKSKPPSPKAARSLLSSGAGKDCNLFACKTGGGSHIVREELPVSYGFWDGNRIQTGLSTLPESTVMMAKYPTSLAGLSFYAPKDGLGNNGLLTDYQQSYMQNLSSDGKRVENFNELQKLNGRDVFSGFQQQRRVTSLGTNMVGGDILVGSEEVSDPVKALRLHYAARAKVEVESWKTDLR